jgi:hypothetical protein
MKAFDEATGGNGSEESVRGQRHFERSVESDVPVLQERLLTKN